MTTAPVSSISKEDVVKAVAPRSFALLVGINEFDSPDWKPLRYAEKDAAGLAEALRPKFDEVAVLSGKAGTTRDAIAAAVEKLASAATDPDDVVLLYFSTHGTLDRAAGKLRPYLLASDTDTSRLAETALPVEYVLDLFDKLSSKRKVVIFSSCYNGTGKSWIEPSLAQELAGMKGAFFPEPLIYHSTASVVISASAWGEPALETEELSHDVYTYFFLEGLKSGDRNNDGAVTVTEAHDYAREKVFLYTKGAQRPAMTAEVVGVDPIVLSGKVERPGDPELYAYEQRFEGVKIEVDGELKGVFPKGVVLPAGSHFVKIVEPGAVEPLFEGEVDLDQDERLSISQLIERSRFGVMVSAGQRLGQHKAAVYNVDLRLKPKGSGFFLLTGLSGASGRGSLQDRLHGELNFNYWESGLDLGTGYELRYAGFIASADARVRVHYRARMFGWAARQNAVMFTPAGTLLTGYSIAGIGVHAGAGLSAFGTELFGGANLRF